MCRYPIWNADSDVGSSSPLYCEWLRERGIVRTSTTSLTSAPFRSITNASSGRVECPMVKNGFAMVEIIAHKHSTRERATSTA